MKKILLSLCLICACLSYARAFTHTGSTYTSDGSLADTQAAVNAAGTAETVVIPTGTWTWTGSLAVDKAIKLKGASMWSGGSGKALQGGVILKHKSSQPNLVTLTSPASGNIEVSQLAFIDGGTTAYQAQQIYTHGTGKPILLHDCYFEANNAIYRCVDWQSLGGVIWNCSFWTHQEDNNGIRWIGAYGWSKPSTYGTLDTDGTINVYLEDCTFTDVYLGATDSDQWSRDVIRHNVFKNSALTNHGDTNQGIDGSGSRQEEIYDNTFSFDAGANSCSGPDENGYPLKMNYWQYVRSGTFVMYDNVMPDIGACWIGQKASIILIVQKIRRNAGTYGCWNGGYPAPYQPGWGSDGSTITNTIKQSLDPIYIWGNTGGSRSNEVSVQDYNPDQCGHNLHTSDFVKANREYYVNKPKPGYTAYPYPHPLRGGGGTPTPTPPLPSPTPQPTSTPTPVPSPTPGATYEKWIGKQNDWIRANPPTPDP
jgi:hypothetical protein